MAEQRHQDTFVNSEFRVDTRDLKRPSDSKVASAIGWQMGDLFLFKQDFPGSRSMISRDEIEVGGLTRPIRADDGMDISLRNFETHLIDGPEFSKFFGYLLSLKKHAFPDFKFKLPICNLQSATKSFGVYFSPSLYLLLYKAKDSAR
jgi:hypothetical protein